MRLAFGSAVCRAMLLWAASPAVFAVVPTLLAQSSFESPVRGAADDILMIGGYGLSQTDSVVYAIVHDLSRPPQPPIRIPEHPGPDVGMATVVSTQGIPHALTIRLPAALRPGRTYALWVRTVVGESSKPIVINDPRPLWLTPPFVYASESLAGLPRSIKLVGRNLDPTNGQPTRVRLSGPQTMILAARPGSAALNEFVARVNLPASILPGRYRVSASRNGSNWIGLRDQILEVLADPSPIREFSIADPAYGGCHPNDGLDDAACLAKAVEAAHGIGGGTVTFGPGTWNLIETGQAGVVSTDGIVLPEGVGLRGSGPNITRLVRDRRWSAEAPTAALTLSGSNTIEGFTFADSQIFVPGDRIGPFLQVGQNSDQVRMQSQGKPPVVRNVIVSHNVFDRTNTAIGHGGLPIERAFITYNVFGSYRNGLELGGNIFDVSNTFRINDSAVLHNVFRPGSFVELSERTGPIASQIGASHRFDFSDNRADGAAADFLYSPEDISGWRAGFFWHMNGSQEMLLISNNVATCTGDKTGDGEAIALDNSGNTFAFDAMRTALAADEVGITVAGPLASRQHDRNVPIESYYIGHWIQVGSGPGMGQARKIASYSIDYAADRVTFKVSPAWDVVPVAGKTRISVGREFWQILIVGNQIDQRTPLCHKNDRSRAGGGMIALWAQLADSAVVGNQQHDTDGITFHENYNSSTVACNGCGIETFFQVFLDVRSNVIDGKYDSGSDCNPSGISGGVSSSPIGPGSPPTLGYGISISHNLIERADNAVGGAISVAQGWYDGPAPHEWPILDGLIVQHNRIDGSAGPTLNRGCGTAVARRGISFPGSPLTWNTVLYANSCRGVQLTLGPGGKANVRVCAQEIADSCECPPSVAPQ